MTLQTNKTLGGIGALLLVVCCPLAFVAGVFASVLGLVGLILVLIAMKGLSDHYNESGIFNNTLYGILLTIVGAVVSVIAIVVILVDFFLALDIETSIFWSDPTAFSAITWQDLPIFDALWTHVVGILLTLLALFVIVVIAAVFYRKSLISLAEKTGVGLFGTAGLLLLIGAALTIILIGFLLIWVALILMTIAFFQISAEPTPPPPPTL